MRRTSQRGFTLIELLVVIGIIGILIMLLLPATRGSHESARRASCSVKLKNLATALHTYHDSFQTFPPSAFCKDGQSLGDKEIDIKTVEPGTPSGARRALYSFIVKLLPYFEKGYIFDAIDFKHNEAFAGTGAQSGYVQAAQIIPVLNCPSFRGSGSTPNSAASDYSPPAGTSKPALTNYKALGATTLACLEDSSKVCDDRLNGGTIHPYATYNFKTLKAPTQTAVLVETKEEKYAAWFDGTTASIAGFHPATGNVADGYATTASRKGTPALNLCQQGTQADFMTPTQFGGKEPMHWGPSSDHPGLVNHVMGGTETKSIQNDIDPAIYAALLSRRADDNDGLTDLLK